MRLIIIPTRKIKVKVFAILLLLLNILTTSAFASKPIVYLEQGWTQQQRQAFYEIPQGSYLIPLKWYLSLEQPDVDELFSRRSHIKKFNYLIKNETDGDVADLPLGFAIEPVDNGDDWVGYTCAACHTNEIEYKGYRIRVDGAPALSDFAGFIDTLKDAVQATLQDSDKFDRFAKRVVGKSDAQAKLALREALEDYANTIAGFTVRNHTDIEYGYARLDAFGIIMNEVFSDDLRVPENNHSPNAPVSYPFLWGTPQHDWVQWNGSANNPLGRNVGEVLGTFGAVNLHNPAQLGVSTARAANLIQLENLVTSLQTPQWPEEYLGAIDNELAEEGLVLYQQFRGDEPSCAYCHTLKDDNGMYPLTPAEENLFGAQFVVTQMTPLAEIGTDSVSALNFATRVVSTGGLAPVLPAPFTGASELPAPALLSILVGLATQTSLAMSNPPLSDAEVVAAIGYRIKATDLPPYQPKNLLAYRARPLDGIWATAPYLHNGSVQNLYELLLPAEKRKKEFYVGSMKFDPKHVGFESKDKKNSSLLNTTLPGNSNLGHEYGVTLSEHEKWALIEFLKTL
ncbi:di-heme-cytochrome C peroxidase [Kaarinaea lacus]